MKGGKLSFSISRSPDRETAVLALVGVVLIAELISSRLNTVLLVVAGLGAIPIVVRVLRQLIYDKFRITIEVFNLFAIVISFLTLEARSAAFIILMVTSADVLEFRARRKTENAVRSLLSLKPEMAKREKGIDVERIPAKHIRKGDILVVETGDSIPADGVIVAGDALINEALVTGESMPVQKGPGAPVLVSTIVETGVIKVRATHIGSESTIEKMAELIKGAQANKSRPERMADRFAASFLPILLVLGAVIYFRTHDLRMTAALFLIACADDMALAIPLAMTAAIGRAAKRGVIIKGGEFIDSMSRAKTVVLDKTGTLTYGNFKIQRVRIDPAFTDQAFWRAVGIADKFTQHPVGHALLTEAYLHVKNIPDPDSIEVLKGVGAIVHKGQERIAVGNKDIMKAAGIRSKPSLTKAINEAEAEGTVTIVLINDALAGTITVSDKPRVEAAASLREMIALGISNIMMFTGDNDVSAKRIGSALGIKKIRAEMKPKDKLQSLGRLREGPVIMVGDGINDAPALARADVGVAMGRGGTAIASEAADVIVLTDNLGRLPEMIRLSRRTMSVINWDILIWGLSNVVGFWLVFSGYAGPATAAFYNFATDFLPLINSARLFRVSINK